MGIEYVLESTFTFHMSFNQASLSVFHLIFGTVKSLRVVATCRVTQNKCCWSYSSWELLYHTIDLMFSMRSWSYWWFYIHDFLQLLSCCLKYPLHKCPSFKKTIILLSFLSLFLVLVHLKMRTVCLICEVHSAIVRSSTWIPVLTK